MKIWIKAIGVACLVELPLLIPLAVKWSVSPEKVIPDFLTMYHVLAIPLAITVLNIIWNHQSHPSTPDAVLFFLVYAFQVMLTTPVMFFLLKGIERVRSHRKGN
jgi:hypothetical protein